MVKIIKEYIKDYRIATLLILVIIFAILDIKYGIHFGIEFVGGYEIPAHLVYPANPDQMAQEINVLQNRLSKFGLSQVEVQGIGNSDIEILIPNSSVTNINQTIKIIENRGFFLGIVNGKEVLNSSSIIPGSIGYVVPTGPVSSWSVSFLLTTQAAANFAKLVYGEGNQPLYMFLDRPNNTIVVLNKSLLPQSFNYTEEINAINNATRLGNSSIPVIIFSNTSNLYNQLDKLLNKYSKIIAPSNLKLEINKSNVSIEYMSIENITPEFVETNNSKIVLNSWPAIGLLSAPILSPSITNGNVTQSYEISGPIPPGITPQQSISYALNNSKLISTILSGGALPVPIIVEPYSHIPPTLGKHFLYISGIAGLFAIILVIAIITYRYKRPFLIIPIIITTLSEIFLIFSIIGLVGTVDLAAVAGIIAVVGTGVDAQIIITDEILTKREGSIKNRLNNAFYIVWLNASMLIVAMLPLLFNTSLIQVIGFAESTVLGALVGVLITRPSYAAIISKHYKEKQ